MHIRKHLGTTSFLLAAAFASASAQASAISFASFEEEVIYLVNIERAAVGLDALLLDTRLEAAAEAHSIDMGTSNCFQHDSCNGTSWVTRIQSFYPGGGFGENIAAGFTTPSSVVQGWMNSPGHKANILDASYRGIGVGYYAASGATYPTYWTQDFGTLVPAPVPEPESYAMLLAGLGLIGLIARRRIER